MLLKVAGATSSYRILSSLTKPQRPVSSVTVQSIFRRRTELFLFIISSSMRSRHAAACLVVNVGRGDISSLAAIVIDLRAVYSAKAHCAGRHCAWQTSVLLRWPRR